MELQFHASLMETLLDEAKSDGIERYAVGAGIRNAAGELLVLRRKADDSFPGMYEIPGGGVEAGESIFEAVARETLEETGLHVKAMQAYCGMFDYDEKGRTRQFSFLVEVSDYEDIKLSEHDSFLWIHSAQGLRCTPEMKRVIESMLQYN